MRNWPAITRDELLHWAKTPEGSVQLPQLIRRLVLETGDITEPVRIPGGSGVSTGGFDGAVAASRATTYIPAGSSVWEMSVSAKLSRKADEDYSKRKAAPNGLPTSDVTYVQVICRPWTKRDQWADARTAEGRWREVRAYNVDDIAAWLETAPATTLWLADVLGMPVEGVRTVREWWDAWSGSTIPALGPEILLAGRNKQATETLDRLAAGAGITTIGGDLRAEEVSAFVAAVAFSSGETRLSLEPTLLFVDDRQSLRRLLKTTRPLVILLADPSLADEIEPGTIHHLIVPITGEAGDIILPAVDPRQVTEALRSEGLDAGRAAELGHLARRSILALRRRLAARPELHRPGWSALGAGAMLRRVLLLNTWDQDVDGDREVVSQLIGTDYSTIEDELLRMAGAPEAPMVANLDGCWHVVSPMDAWLLLGSQLTREDLQRFPTRITTERGATSLRSASSYMTRSASIIHCG